MSKVTRAVHEIERCLEMILEYMRLESSGRYKGSLSYHATKIRAEGSYYTELTSSDDGINFGEHLGDASDIVRSRYKIYSSPAVLLIGGEGETDPNLQDERGESAQETDRIVLPMNNQIGDDGRFALNKTAPATTAVMSTFGHKAPFNVRGVFIRLHWNVYGVRPDPEMILPKKRK